MSSPDPSHSTEVIHKQNDETKVKEEEVPHQKVESNEEPSHFQEDKNHLNKQHELENKSAVHNDQEKEQIHEEPSQQNDEHNKLIAKNEDDRQKHDDEHSQNNNIVDNENSGDQKGDHQEQHNLSETQQKNLQNHDKQNSEERYDHDNPKINQSSLQEINMQLSQMLNKDKKDDSTNSQQKQLNEEEEGHFREQQNDNHQEVKEEQAQQETDVNFEQDQQQIISESNTVENKKDAQQNEEELFDTEEKRIEIEELNERLQSLFTNIQQSYHQKSQFIMSDANTNFPQLLLQYDQCLEKQTLNNEQSDKLQNEDIKERAYELLAEYHSELVILRKQKQKDDEEIKRLNELVKSNQLESNSLKTKISDLEELLKAQIRQTSHRENSISKQFDYVYNPQQTSSELKPLNIRKVQSSYSSNSNPYNPYEGNSFIGLVHESPSPNKEMNGINNTYRDKTKEKIENDSLTSFNLSPSAKKKPIVIKKPQDSFYNNKKRLSIRRDQAILQEHPEEPEQLQLKQKHRVQQEQKEQIPIFIDNQKQSKLAIHLNGKNIHETQGTSHEIKQTPSPKPIDQQSNGVLKYRQQRVNSYRGNSFYDKQMQKTPILVDGTKDNGIEKANNKIKQLINEQKSYSMNQNNSLWINSIDIGDLDTQNDLNNSKQLAESNEEPRKVEAQYDPKIQKSKQQIKIIANPRQNSHDMKAAANLKPLLDKNANTRIRKSYSINQSSQSSYYKLDPLQSQKQLIQNK